MSLTSIITALFGWPYRRKIKALEAKLALQKLTLLRFEQDLMRQASKLEQFNAQVMENLQKGEQK